MNAQTGERLDKVLALADSAHDGEAVGAVRMARQILHRDGLSFGDLARAAGNRSRFSRTVFSGFSGTQVQLEARINELQGILDSLQKDQESQTTQIEFWRRRAFELEQQLNLSVAEARKWKVMARETLEKLWDIGKLTRSDEFTSDTPAADPASAAMQKAK